MTENKRGSTFFTLFERLFHPFILTYAAIAALVVTTAVFVFGVNPFASYLVVDQIIVDRNSILCMGRTSSPSNVRVNLVAGDKAYKSQHADDESIKPQFNPDNNQLFFVLPTVNLVKGEVGNVKISCQFVRQGGGARSDQNISSNEESTVFNIEENLLRDSVKVFLVTPEFQQDEVRFEVVREFDHNVKIIFDGTPLEFMEINDDGNVLTTELIPLPESGERDLEVVILDDKVQITNMKSKVRIPEFEDFYLVKIRKGANLKPFEIRDNPPPNGEILHDDNENDIMLDPETPVEVIGINEDEDWLKIKVKPNHSTQYVSGWIHTDAFDHTNLNVHNLPRTKDSY